VKLSRWVIKTKKAGAADCPASTTSREAGKIFLHALIVNEDPDFSSLSQEYSMESGNYAEHLTKTCPVNPYSSNGSPDCCGFYLLGCGK
jgi:hypothetical protein